mgnify:CR=1 FL=1
MDLDKKIREIVAYTAPEFLAKRIKRLVLDEREACAAIAANWSDPGAGTAWDKADLAQDDIADAILARTPATHD